MPLASSIADKEHLRVIDEIIEERFTALELQTLLIYVIDTVDSRALPFLASQLNVTGLRGWTAAKTDSDRRELIKRAIELNRYAGTPYAVRAALRSVGYANAFITEGTGAFYNGEFFYDNFINYGSGIWATFTVLLDIGESKGINLLENEEAAALINEWKNQRSKLTALTYQATVSDTLIPRESDSDSLNLDITSQDGVDPLSEENNLTVTQEEIVDIFHTLTDSDTQLTVLNSQGDVIEIYNF